MLFLQPLVQTDCLLRIRVAEFRESDRFGAARYKLDKVTPRSPSLLVSVVVRDLVKILAEVVCSHVLSS